MKRKGGNDIGKMIKLNKAVPMVLLACAVLHGAAADVRTTPQQQKERRILSCLRGTPSAAEAPRDILVNKPDYVVYVPKQPRKPELRNSFYTSYTVQDGKGVLWFNDAKFYLLGREIGPEWFE